MRQGMLPCSTMSSRIWRSRSVSIERQKSLVLVSHELTFRDQSRERLEHELLALLQVVEDLAPEDEVAAVDPDLGAVGSAELLHVAIRVDIGEVVGEGRADREEAGDLPALLEGVDHLVEMHVRQAVAVIGEEDIPRPLT